MNRFLFFWVVLMMFVSCSPKKTKTNDTGISKQEQIQVIPKAGLNAKPGEYVLTPPAKFLDSFNIKSDKYDILLFYPRKMVKVGKFYSYVQEFDTVVKVPNIFIIPITGNQEAKKGDFVLTWWKTGTAMQRAYVLDATDPYRPTVLFLDTDWFGSADQKQKIAKLDSGTFRVIRKPLDPGTSVAYLEDSTYQFYIVINTVGDTVVAMGWSNSIRILSKKQVMPNEIHVQLQPGEAVYVPLYGIYTPATVEKTENGQVRVKISLLGEVEERLFPLLDIRKTL